MFRKKVLRIGNEVSETFHMLRDEDLRGHVQVT